MARLHEYQGKAILAANGFKIPRGRAASTTDEAIAAAKELADGNKAADVVIKIQAWTTGRAGIGGVGSAKKPDDVRGIPSLPPLKRDQTFPCNCAAGDSIKLAPTSCARLLVHTEMVPLVQDNQGFGLSHFWDVRRTSCIYKEAPPFAQATLRESKPKSRHTAKRDG